MVIVIACVVAGGGIVSGVTVFVRRANRELTQFKTLAVRHEAKAVDAAAESERLAGIVQDTTSAARDAMHTVDGALDVARQIADVHAKVDVLIDRTHPEAQPDVAPSRGRHARTGLRVVDDEQDRRHIA